MLTNGIDFNDAKRVPVPKTTIDQKLVGIVKIASIYINNILLIIGWFYEQTPAMPWSPKSKMARIPKADR